MDKNKNFWYNNTNKTRFLCINNKDYIPISKDKLVCKRCGTTVTKPHYGWIGQCELCKAYISFFKPTPIQLVASIAQTSVIVNLGAYGSGKTTISSYRISTMMRQIPGARTICVANTKDQLKQNAASELEKFFHPSEFENKNKELWTLKNGGLIEFWPSDNPDKLRSANANFVWIVEGHSQQMRNVYKELLARIRNDKGFVYELDSKGNKVLEKTSDGQMRDKILKSKNFIIIEANPVRGSWINKEILKAHTMIYTTSVRGMEIIKQQVRPARHINEITEKEENADIISIMNATIDNPTLPHTYIRDLRLKCDSEDEYDRALYCDITSKEGLVYEQVVTHPNEYFLDEPMFNLYNLNENMFVEGFDLGGSNVGNDPDAYLLGMFNTRSKRLHFLDEMKISGLTVDESTKHIRAIRAKWGWRPQNSLFFVSDNAIDRSSKQNRNHSVKNDFEIRLGTRIIPCNQKNINHGTKLVNQWFNNKAITFNTGLESIKQELFSYEMYEEVKIGKGGQETQTVMKFSDINNHLLDALRYIIVQLEGYGYRQDQAYIDFYNQQMKNLKVESANDYKDKVSSLNKFLPEVLGGDKPAPQKRFIKF